MLKDLRNVYSQVDKLQSASKQIGDGAKTLAQGTTTYYEKSQEFNQGVKQFSQGVSKANSSYSELNAGISSIDSGSKQLQTGSKQLSDGTAALDAGVDTMRSKVSASAGKIPELVNGASQVYGGLEQLYSGISTSASAENPDTTNKLTALVTEEKTQAGTLLEYNKSLTSAKAGLEAIDTSSMDTTTVAAIQTAIGTLDAQIKANNKVAGTLNTNADNYVALVQGIKADTKTQLQGLAQNVETLKDGAKQLIDGTSVVQSSMKELNGGLDTLSNSTKQLSKGASELYSGTATLAAGASQVKAGSVQMKAGLNELDTSAKVILDANTQLTEGAKTIQEGATQLSSGIEEFNNTGINKVCNFINNDVRNLTDRIQILKDLSSEYNSFTKTAEDTESNVKFITIVDAIKKKDSNKGQEEIDEKPAK